MRAIHRKLFRDLWHQKGPAVAIALVIGCGVGVFVMALSTLDSLQTAQRTYYERFGFPTIFAQVKRAPLPVAERARELPGVSDVLPRVVADVTLDVPGMVELASAKFVSYIDQPPGGLNSLYLRQGRLPEPDERGVILLHEAFASEHGLLPGDSLVGIINNRRQSFRIVGIALSPEFIYPIRPGEMLPDSKRYGVVWMPHQELAAAYNMEGAFNDLAIRLSPEESTQEFIARLDTLLDPWGGTGAYSREDQISHKFLSNELVQLANMAVITPSVFLGVAAFLMQVVMSRLISTQREQVAALKALGYSRYEIGAHYLAYVLILCVMGVAVGAFFGTLLGRELTGIYSKFFRFPSFYFSLPPRVVLLSGGVSTLAAIGGTFFAVKRAMDLPPAEALRPEQPTEYRLTIIERMGLAHLLSPSARMVLRYLERQPLRSLFSVLGVSMSVAVLMLGAFIQDTLNHVIDFQFLTNQHQDVTVAFREPLGQETLHELQRLPGVKLVEPLRSVPVRIRHGQFVRRLGLLGVPHDRTLMRVLNTDETPAPLPAGGLVISEKLAEVLHAKLGDTLTVEILEGDRPVHQLPLAATVSDYMDVSSYVEIETLHDLLKESDLVTGAFLTIDPLRLPEFFKQLKEVPAVASVSVKRAALESFRETLAENLLRMRAFNLFFASMLAVGVIYNCARITLAERSREFATLRVIGFTRHEISAILLGELATLTLIGMPLGIPVGFGLVAWATTTLQTEMQRFPLIIHRSTLALATFVVLLAALFSALVVRRRLDHLDLITALKIRD